MIEFGVLMNVCCTCFGYIHVYTNTQVLGGCSFYLFSGLWLGLAKQTRRLLVGVGLPQLQCCTLVKVKNLMMHNFFLVWQRRFWEHSSRFPSVGF